MFQLSRYFYWCGEEEVGNEKKQWGYSWRQETHMPGALILRWVECIRVLPVFITHLERRTRMHFPLQFVQYDVSVLPQLKGTGSQQGAKRAAGQYQNPGGLRPAVESLG